MQPPSPAHTDREETYSGHTRLYYVYAPVLWAMVWVLRAGLRLGVISPDFLMPSREDVTPHLFHRNRQLRRARASCLRRARRCAIKHGKINKEDYTPRAYAHYAYVNMMDKTVSPGQFMERYIRDNDLSRVQVYGLDTAHRINGFAASLAETLSGVFSSFQACFGLSPLNLAAPTDPAPP